MKSKVITSFKPSLLCVLLIAISVSAQQRPELPNTTRTISHPNIILIQADMQRYDALGAYGNPYINTPNLDRLAQSGTYFRHAYATSPVCAPSRWSLFSGMYTTSHQAYSNQHEAEGIELPTSLPMELKRLGYTNALIGKNHSFLSNREFDILRPIPENGHDFTVTRLAPRAAPWPAREDPMYLLTDRTLQFIDQRQAQEQPYFIWLSYLYPHTPYQVPEPYFSMYKDRALPPLQQENKGLEAAGKPFRQIFHQENNDRLLPFDDETTALMRHTYYGMVSLVDDQVGRLFDHLDRLGQRNDTIVIFTSDHGDYQGDHHMYTKSPAMYDCLIRVPLIFSWPGRIEAVTPDRTLVSQVDVMPTLLSLVGVDIPQQVQGIDLSKSLISGKWDREVRDVVFAEYGLPGASFDRQRLEEVFPDYKENPLNWAEGVPYEANPVSLAGRFRMARTLEWKYVEYEDGDNELYNMVHDPHELTNLYGTEEHSTAARALQKALREWKKDLPGIERDKEDLVPSFVDFYKRKTGRE
ncbi:MAG: sulfatase-like hydrolase/transferase [Luteitalea sp.]|nr:sulfatase-like hydrolase/transferase [Luteitalea sp.]